MFFIKILEKIRENMHGSFKKLRNASLIE